MQTTGSVSLEWASRRCVTKILTRQSNVAVQRGRAIIPGPAMATHHPWRDAVVTWSVNELVDPSAPRERRRSWRSLVALAFVACALALAPVGVGQAGPTGPDAGLTRNAPGSSMPCRVF